MTGKTDNIRSKSIALQGCCETTLADVRAAYKAVKVTRPTNSDVDAFKVAVARFKTAADFYVEALHDHHCASEATSATNEESDSTCIRPPTKPQAELDPETLHDVTVIMAAYVARGTLAFDQIAKGVRAELGEGYEPYLFPAWKDAFRMCNEMEKEALAQDNE